MKLEKSALVAEIVGSIAIVATLVILIFEVRENTRAIQVANRQSIATRAQEMALTLARQPDIRRALVELSGGNAAIYSETLGAASAFLDADLKIAEEAYLLFLEGQLSEEYWQTRAAIALNLLNAPELREAYKRARDSGFYQPEFTIWLDRALVEKYGQ